MTAKKAALSAALVPFVVCTLWLLCAEYVFPKDGLAAFVGWAVVAASIAFGTYALTRLPLSVMERVVLSCLYVVAIAGILLIYSLLFVGVFFGDWL